MTTGILMGNVGGVYVATVSFDAASVAANTTAEQDITVRGVKVGDAVFINKPSLSAGLGVVNARVKTTDTVSVTYVNATASPIDASAETYVFVIVRPERAPVAGAAVSD